MTDNRRAARKKTFLTAYASFDIGGRPTPCLVRDISRSGARILLASAGRAPQIFDLRINGRAQVWRVETVWRRPTAIGVRLLAKFPDGDGPRRPPLFGPGDERPLTFHVDARAIERTRSFGGAPGLLERGHGPRP